MLITHRALLSNPLAIPIAPLQAALLCGRDQDLRQLVQEAGQWAPDVRRQIRCAAQMRPVRARGLRGAGVHLVAMPALLDYGSAGARCPAEVRLVTPAAEHLRGLWQCAFGAQAHEVVVLPQVVHLDAVLGISPLAVHECAFFGASLIEGARTQIPKLRLPDRHAREAGKALVAPYLLLALAVCPEGLAHDEAAWRRVRLEVEQLVTAMFATRWAQPRLTLMAPRQFFDAIDAAQVAQLVHAARWLARKGGAQRFEFRHLERGHIDIEYAHGLTPADGLGQMLWTYDSTWREPPDLRAIARAAALRARSGAAGTAGEHGLQELEIAGPEGGAPLH